MSMCGDIYCIIPCIYAGREVGKKNSLNMVDNKGGFIEVSDDETIKKIGDKIEGKNKKNDKKEEKIKIE